MIARAPQLLRVSITDVDGFTAAFLPQNYDGGSEVAVEPVVWREWFGWPSGLEPPFSAACALEL